MKSVLGMRNAMGNPGPPPHILINDNFSSQTFLGGPLGRLEIKLRRALKRESEIGYDYDCLSQNWTDMKGSYTVYLELIIKY